MPAPPRCKVLLVGVGGQGVLTSAQILGDAAHHAGLQVVVGQLHGMSQRGGSVECSVLIGPGQSSLVTGEVDLLVGFEPLEVLRALHHAGPRTRVLLNATRIVPSLLTRAAGDYPDLPQILAQVCEVTPTATVVDGPGLVEEAAAPRALNVVMLGALAGLDALPLDGDAVRQAVVRRCSPRFAEANLRAFDLGRRWVRQGAPPAAAGPTRLPLAGS